MKKYNFKTTDQEYTNEEYVDMQVKWHNESKGDLTDCDKCHGRGDIAFAKNGEVKTKQCDCIVKRNNLMRIKESGMLSFVEKYKMSNFQTEKPHQKLMYDKAKSFIKSGLWLYVGGQIGSGKTHICTAVATELMERGLSAKYMMWRSDAFKIKQSENRALAMDNYVNVDVLYIDDLFKAGATDADIGLAFDILNDRYYNNKKTIISSELTLPELENINEALSSRIAECAGEHVVNVRKDKKKDERVLKRENN